LRNQLCEVPGIRLPAAGREAGEQRGICMLKRCLGVALAVLCLPAVAVVWPVGPGRSHVRPSEVASLVGDGDTVLIDAGTYRDVCSWRAHNLVLRGTGGRAVLDAAGMSLAEDKAIWVIKGSSVRVESIEFANASCPDQNGAGIRQEGTGLTASWCVFRDNENGILTGADSLSDITVEYSEFRRNGFGDGYSHNLYIGRVRSFTLRYCWSHRARVGHQVKSRARTNYIVYNRIMDEDSGAASREIDLPNGGRSYVIGNLLHKGQDAENSNMVGYALEGVAAGYDTVLFCVNNTMVNQRSPTGPFLQLSSGTRVLVCSDVFHGGTEIVRGGRHQGSSNWMPAGHHGDDSLTGNVVGADPGLANPAGFDYRLLPWSPCIDSGVMPDSALRPVFQYIHPCDREPRQVAGAMDIGAYEYAGTGLIEVRSSRARSEAALMVSPSPFFDHASVHNHEGEWFVVCDRAGRRVGEYPGGSLGAGLPPGVYLLLDPAHPGRAVPFIKLGQRVPANAR
jgi:hypothetical protein